MENIITYLKKTTFWKLLLGLVLLPLSFYVFLFNNVIVGIFFLGLGLSFLTTEGTQIDLGNSTYREIRSLLGFHFGKWKPCPEFEYLSVFRAKDSVRVGSIANSVILKTDAVFINLFFKNRKHITVYKTDEKSDAFKVAEHLKMALNIDILDATEKNKVWL